MLYERVKGIKMSYPKRKEREKPTRPVKPKEKLLIESFVEINYYGLDYLLKQLGIEADVSHIDGQFKPIGYDGAEFVYKRLETDEEFNKRLEEYQSNYYWYKKRLKEYNEIKKNTAKTNLEKIKAEMEKLKKQKEELERLV
jgi:hypothetical protein